MKVCQFEYLKRAPGFTDRNLSNDHPGRLQAERHLRLHLHRDSCGRRCLDLGNEQLCCELRLTVSESHRYVNDELRVNNARASSQPAALHLIIYRPKTDMTIHLYLCSLAETPVKASKAANRDHLLASILRLCKKIHQATPQPCTSSSTRMGNKETSQPVRSKRKDSKKYLGRFVSRHAPA
jgi:hypothetical protein